MPTSKAYWNICARRHGGSGRYTISQRAFTSPHNKSSRCIRQTIADVLCCIRRTS
jgi:hypothetical protein